MAQEAQEQTPGGIHWGMVIDIDKCTGCKACIVSCRSENNIPTLGSEMCARGRLMDWLQVERFWHTSGEEVISADFIPMLCQHCGTAPCESVCPVFASIHTPDQLNAQIYNRCVGTRLCATNCPYHVRVFNFVQPRWPSPMENLLNPSVSVRNEGMMEKCTFCIQRLRQGRFDAVSAGKRDIFPVDGEIRTACAQACPTNAIVFGNLDDPESTVNHLVHDNEERSHRVLNEGYHTNPSIYYLRPVRETHVI